MNGILPRLYENEEWGSIEIQVNDKVYMLCENINYTLDIRDKFVVLNCIKKTVWIFTKNYIRFFLIDV